MPKSLWIFTLFFLAGCAAAEIQPAPYAPYYLVTAPAAPSRTPFQPQETPAASTATPPTPPYFPPTDSPTPAPSPSQTSSATPQFIPPASLPNAEVISFLLLGSDLRPGSSYRTDTLVVALLRPHEGQVSLISIPRDLWVQIPGVGEQRINTAYQSGELSGYPGGGPALLKDTILNNLGIAIDHTALVDFDGFRKIVDALGGVNVPVACPYTDWRLVAQDLNPEDENNWSLFTAGPGLIHMDGDLALWYARSRKKSNDFDRGRRQQETLRALYRQFLNGQGLTRLPQLYAELSASVQTDLGLNGLVELSPLALTLNNADIRSYYIAGELVTPWITPGGAYVLLPNAEAIQSMLSAAMAPSNRQTERQKIRVEIQNGSANDGWEALAAERLNYAGYEASIFAADNRQHSATLLYDLTRDQDEQRAASLLAVLGLDSAALVRTPGDGSIAYVLLLGNDYQPCFQPQALTP